MTKSAQPLEPMQVLGGHFNIRDQAKFQLGLQLLRESTSGLPFFSSDNLITWNRNLSFLQDEYFLNLLKGSDADNTEKTCIWRLYILLYFAEHCQSVKGDYIELGCYKGSTAKRVTERVQFRALCKHYYLYDLFSWNPGDDHTNLEAHNNPRMYEDVVERFVEQTWVSVIKGSVPQSFSQGFPDQIAFAHIDMNSPDPESGALKEVIPRLAPGACVVFDDYGWWGYSAQKRALDPIASSYGLSILELPTGQGLLLKH